MNVAHRRPGCRVCASVVVFHAVNGAIWDGATPAAEARSAGYRVRGRAAARAHGLDVDLRTVSRHAIHVEAAARDAGPLAPPAAEEIEVYPSDFEGITERFTRVGMAALDSLEGLAETGDPRDRIAIAKLGLTAATARKTASQRDAAMRRGGDLTDPRLVAIFLPGSGHAPEIPDGLAIDVTPLADMRAAMRAERAALEARARDP